MFTHPVCFLGAAGTSTPTLYNTLGLDIAESQYLSLTDSTDFNFGTAYTFCCWVYPTDLSVENGIYNQPGSSLNFAQMSILPTGKMSFKATYGGTISIDIESDVTLLENNLYMIGFQVIGSTLSFIINGVHDTNSGSFAVAPNDLATNLQLARVHEGVNFFYFSGAFSLPMAFQAALGPQALLDIYNGGTAKQPECYDATTITDNYAFAIPLNDGVDSGQELVDVSGNGNNAFLFGSPTPVYDGEQQGILTCPGGGDPTIFAVNSASYNGVSNYFNGGDILDVGTGDASVSFWFKTTNGGTTARALVTKQNGAFPQWGIRTNSSGTINAAVEVSGGHSYYYDTTSTVNDGMYHHVVWIFNRASNIPIVYIDGSLEAMVDAGSVGDVSTGSLSNSANLFIGARDLVSKLLMIGSMAFIRMAAEDLDSTDVANLYNSGNPRCFDGIAATTKAKLTAAWELGNWTDSTGTEIEDRVGANDLTNVGSTPFTESGLDVSCGGTPPAETFNILTESGDSLTTESSDNLILE